MLEPRYICVRREKVFPITVRHGKAFPITVRRGKVLPFIVSYYCKVWKGLCTYFYVYNQVVIIKFVFKFFCISTNL